MTRHPSARSNRNSRQPLAFTLIELLVDQSAHLGPNRLPDGGNLLMLDGHSEWRNFNNMKVRTTGNDGSTPAFWW